jgi:hypothetical protein
MMPDFEAVSASLARAKTPEDVFGKIADGHDRIQVIGRMYKQIVHIIHPDHNPEVEARAGEAFQTLTRFRSEAEARVRSGIYWTKQETPKPPAVAAPRVVDVKGKRYVMEGHLATGDIADLHLGHEGTMPIVFKVAAHPSDNDLLESETKVVRDLTGRGNDTGRTTYLCPLVDSFLLKSKTQTRRTNVLWRAVDYRTIAEVARVYPNGLDFRDLAWMFKRTLGALWYLHREGYVHGAILPEHVLIHPVTHGAKLVDFCYAVKAGQPLRAMSGPRRDHYPPEVPAKQAATPATDIYMAASMFAPMLARGTPGFIAGFFNACMLANPNRRPQDAGDLHDEFDALLTKHVGKKKYRPFPMPAEGSAT